MNSNNLVLTCFGTKSIKDLKIGEYLISSNNLKTKILDIHKNIDTLYKIKYENGEFIIPEKQILMLNFNKTIDIQMSVIDYFTLSQDVKNNLYIYSSIIDFPENIINIDPYTFGVFIGINGDTEIDSNILEHITKSNEQYDTNKKSQNNMFIAHIFSNLKIVLNKRIPYDFLFNSKKIKYELLAGIIDCNSYVNKNNLIIENESKITISDISFLLKSLGFYIKEYDNKIEIISGSFENIPCIVKSLDNLNNTTNDKLLISFTLEKLELCEYISFTLENDTYLNSDFIVLKN